MHHPDSSLGMKTSTVEAVSGVALESKSYIRSYSPYMDDGFSTDSSISSPPIIAEETISIALTDAIQQAKTSGPGASVSIVEDVSNSDETVYESAVEPEAHMDYEASSICKEHCLYLMCWTGENSRAFR